MIAEVRGEVRHSTAEAGRAEATAFAGKRDEAARPTAVAGNSDESVSQDAALEKRLDLVDHEVRQAWPLPSCASVAARNDRQCCASSLWRTVSSW